MQNNLRETIAAQFTETRRRTLQIFDFAEESVLHESPGFGFRPILWHLAHIGAFEEYWLLNKVGGANPINERFQRIFDPIKTPRESSKILPSKNEMLDFLQKVRGSVENLLEKFDFNDDDELKRGGYIFNLVLQHELQHQETLAYLFHLLPPSSKKSNLPDIEFHDSQFAIHHSSLEIAAGNLIVGASGSDFVYDNELPAHEKFIPAFRLDKYLTTNAEFAEFIAEKGYQRRELWTEEGWAFQQQEDLQNPLYWRNVNGDWRIQGMFDEKSLNETANFPVYGISFYEAAAYANFRGKRLPTEFEWEQAAALEPLNVGKTNYNLLFGDTTPVDRFESEHFADLRGNLWEYTSSNFAAYPNFRAFPYEDYSELWFDGDHKVLKGGSFATAPEMLRTSFRNFFRRGFRIAFAGIRLAENA